ncbi:uncharacterized protein LOC115875773 [Sitophilus oryzae]|uniref:Uncharacterized protein LOC115875773 n=1 Tax=Sitophilus oryzae TaxID=7048 RepID=A0A6J2X7C0_SITOR|nr:uncharacterized protein LOC115875773 [Sitophilus oryzae]
MEQRLLALEMDFWRRSGAGVSRMERIQNKKIRESMHIQHTIIDEIERRQLVWYGHVEIMSEDRIPKKVLKWIPSERRKRGRPKAMRIGGIHKAISEKPNLHPGDWENRKGWQLGTGRRRTL